MKRFSQGFSLIEMMVAVTIGILLLSGVAGVYVAQRQLSRSTEAQSVTQNTSASIEAVLPMMLRSAGFAGCGRLTKAVVNFAEADTLTDPYNVTRTALTVLDAYTKPVIGYEASGTAPGSSLALASVGTTGIGASSDWAGLEPALGAAFGRVYMNSSFNFSKGGDVVTMVSQAIGATPAIMGSSSASAPSVSLSSLSTLSVPADGSWSSSTDSVKAITNCVNTVIVGSSSNAAVLPFSQIEFPPVSQAVRIERVAFFVGPDRDGRNSLFLVRMSNGGWVSPQAIASGVNTMQALYQVDLGNDSSQYVPADQVTDWTRVHSIRLGFLLEGPKGSAAPGGPTSWSVLGTRVTPPADTRLRHVMELTVNLRNS